MKSLIEQPATEHPVVLTPETIVGYCENLALPQLEGALSAADSSTGNLNFCFIISAEAGGSVFVKQAPDFVRVLGEDAKLTTDRIRIEASAALEFIDLAPGLLPQLYHFDASSCVLVMEHLGSHVLLQDKLIAGEVSDAPAVGIAQFMAKVHGATFGSERLSSFSNEALCGITQAYVFTLPFIADDSNSNMPALDETVAAIRANEPLLAAIKAALGIFNSKKEALLHGDLHAGSVMTDGTDAKVIDHEFAFYGPAGFDLGLFLAGYTFPWASAVAHKDEAKAAAIVSAMTACVTEYTTAMVASQGAEVAAAIWADALSFMGCELLRRVLGVAKRADLEQISDAATKLQAEKIVCLVGQRVIERGS